MPHPCRLGLAALGLLLLPLLAVAQPSPLSVEQIMQAPETWVGDWPENARWHENGQTLYFDWNPKGQFQSDSLYKVPRGGGKPTKVPPAERRSHPPTFDGWHHGERVYTADDRKKVYAADGDLYLYDRAADTQTRLTDTRAEEAHPRFTPSGDRVVFRREDNLFALTVSFGGLLRGVTAQEQVSRLEELSMTDHLTGLHNRRFLNMRMEEELNRSSRQDLDLAVMMIDIDYFKQYNDICGHLAGDKALEKLADILKGSSRAMDVVARFGGEEFCIILPGASREETKVVAARIQDTIDRETFVAEELLPLGRLTASIGIAFFPRDGKTPQALVNAADGALYKAKAAGRNAICVYQPDSA